jgi:hypothetical protein
MKMGPLKFCYALSGVSLWSSSQEFLATDPGFDSRRYQIIWVVGLERGPLSLVKIIEEQLEWISNGSGLENRN